MIIRIISLMCLLVAQSTYATDKYPIMAIDVPMDNKAESQTFHMAIKYRLNASGELSTMRWVQDHSAQALNGKLLSPEELTAATNILAQLPPSRADLPNDQTLRIITYPPLDPVTNVYSRTELPAQMETLFGLFGGIRGEIKEKLKFSLEQSVPAYDAQGAPSAEP